MLFKIIWRSFLRQTRNYFVYFLCMTASVMIFYSFSAMTYDQPLTRRAQQDIQIEGVLTLGNFVVALVVLFFMLSANRFFVQQRQKEFGLYQLFGMRKARIFFQLIIETTVLNVVSIVVGVLLGIVFSKFFAMILVKAMDLNIMSRFFISWPSIASTAGLFLVSIIFVAFQNCWLLWRKPVIEYFHKKNHFASERMRISTNTYFVAILSLLLIGVGYYIAVNFQEIVFQYIHQTKDFSAYLWIPFYVFASCVFGTYLFFCYGIQVLLYLSAVWRKFSYQHLRFYVINNTRNSLIQSWRTLSLISVIVAIAITMIGGAMGLFSLNYRLTELNYPTDFQVNIEQVNRLEQLIQRSGGNVEEKIVVPLKTVGSYGIPFEDVLEEEIVEKFELIDLVSESQFKQLAPYLTEKLEIALPDENSAVLFTRDFTMKQRIKKPKKMLTLPEGQHLEIEKVYSNLVGDSALRYGSYLLVVKDEFYQQVAGYTYQLVYLNIGSKDSAQINQSYVNQLRREWGNEIAFQYEISQDVLRGQIGPHVEVYDQEYGFGGKISRLNHVSRFPELRAVRRQGGIFIYVALFVGMIVLITSASILMVQQFFEAEREKSNYQLLLQLGIPKKTIYRAVYQQKAWIFFPTMLIATLHGSFAIYMINELIQDANYLLAYLFCFMTLLIFTIAYFFTVHFYIRIIEES